MRLKIAIKKGEKMAETKKSKLDGTGVIAYIPNNMKIERGFYIVHNLTEGTWLRLNDEDEVDWVDDTFLATHLQKDVIEQLFDDQIGFGKQVA